MGYLHSLGSAGTATSVSTTNKLLRQLNLKLFHGLLPVAGDSPYKMMLTIATSNRNPKDVFVALS